MDVLARAGMEVWMGIAHVIHVMKIRFRIEEICNQGKESGSCQSQKVKVVSGPEWVMLTNGRIIDY